MGDLRGYLVTEGEPRHGTSRINALSGAGRDSNPRHEG
jgi:hypothetical protein